MIYKKDKKIQIAIRINPSQQLWLKEQKYNSSSAIIRELIEKEMRKNENKN